MPTTPSTRTFDTAPKMFNPFNKGTPIRQPRMRMGMGSPIRWTRWVKSLSKTSMSNTAR